jgi:hypothetical protein
MAAFPGGLGGNERGEDPYNDLSRATKVMSDSQWYSSTREIKQGKLPASEIRTFAPTITVYIEVAVVPPGLGSSSHVPTRDGLNQLFGRTERFSYKLLAFFSSEKLLLFHE